MSRGKWKELIEGTGIIAIVVTLIFVLVEIRQNTQAIEQNAAWMRIAALDAGYDQTSEFRKMLLLEDDIFELWRDGCKGELDVNDAARFRILAVDWLIMMRNIGERAIALGGQQGIDTNIEGTVERIVECPKIRTYFEDLTEIEGISPYWYSKVSEALK